MPRNSYRHRLLTASLGYVIALAACTTAEPPVESAPVANRPATLLPQETPQSDGANPTRPNRGTPAEVRRLRQSSVDNQFVTTCGTRLCAGGHVFRLYGASVFGNLSQPRATIRLARAARLNTLRITNFLYEFDPVADAAYREREWKRVDRFLAAADAAGMRVILDLSTHRNLLRHNGENPYAWNWGPWLRWIGHRVNTVSGRTYADDPTIAIVSIAGEPEPITNNPDPLAAQTPTELRRFFVRSARQLRSVDPNHVISSGGLLQYGWDSGVDWRAIFEAVDICAVHGFSDTDTNGLPAVVDECADAGRPWIVEEFGFPQSMGDHDRANAFRDVLRMIGPHRPAGVAFWNLGSELHPGSHDVNLGTPRTLRVVRQGATFLARKWP